MRYSVWCFDNVACFFLGGGKVGHLYCVSFGFEIFPSSLFGKELHQKKEEEVIEGNCPWGVVV
jgi:hypothetical protein